MTNTVQWMLGHVLLTILIIFLYPVDVHWLRTLLGLVVYVIGSVGFWVYIDEQKVELPGFGKGD